MLLWLKALHIIAVISWMAGLLYLPRLFVYHCDAEPGSRQAETFKVMEQRLLRYIMNPAMIVVWVTGPLLAWQMGMLADRWLLAKFALVVLLTGYHHALGALAQGLRRRPQRARPALLPHGQRGADAADDRHRHPGGGEAVSEARPLPVPAALLQARRRSLVTQSSLSFACEDLLYCVVSISRRADGGGCGSRIAHQRDPRSHDPSGTPFGASLPFRLRALPSSHLTSAQPSHPESFSCKTLSRR